MGAVDHDLLKRLLTRSEEVAAEPGMKVSVVTVYESLLKVPAQAYLAAHAEAKSAEDVYKEKAAAVAVALETFEVLFREARSVVAAFLPTLTLPATLKGQPTDTDQLNAIQDLDKELAKHAGEPWADQLVNGEYGLKAKEMAQALKAQIAAGKARAKARDMRAARFEPAYEPYLRFKKVVRESLGSRSPQYKRIHAPRRAADDAEETEKAAKEAAAKAAAAKDAADKPAADKEAVAKDAADKPAADKDAAVKDAAAKEAAPKDAADKPGADKDNTTPVVVKPVTP